jgi:hypothetical protein
MLILLSVVAALYFLAFLYLRVFIPWVALPFPRNFPKVVQSEEERLVSVRLLRNLGDCDV